MTKNTVATDEKIAREISKSFRFRTQGPFHEESQTIEFTGISSSVTFWMNSSVVAASSSQDVIDETIIH